MLTALTLTHPVAHSTRSHRHRRPWDNVATPQGVATHSLGSPESIELELVDIGGEQPREHAKALVSQ
ncbi:hypothetical protein EVAR_76730_1 [Eumeta japonica]|uniref:Uncharacterized protein n=1 Tax=Eumeta variegata TaxID=151549 RepID=A0A4C1SVM3_EUMVA|nr:hypothetical protein EVAR_76730_1 [Eumeta japonica]